ncbi:MAG: NUDIX domain-containing protein [Candidatus Latescibacteria bacterium]|nr:NUDIX domain-containing protein [Candidatus Latescibacterota bacterium]
MDSTQLWEPRLGVYGLCHRADALLVVHKGIGPYQGRWDLPGGAPETGEALEAALRREVAEETGLEVAVEEGLGRCQFLVPWPSQHYTHLHHVAQFYRLRPLGGALIQPAPFKGQDSLGGAWMPLEELQPAHSSPLVTAAKKWIASGAFVTKLQRLEDWKVLSPGEWSL